MNELSVHEKETVLALLRLGWSVRRVARETKHRRETIDRYGRAAGLIAPKPSTGSKVPTGSGADLGAEPAAPSADDNRDAAVAEQSPTIVLADSTAVPAPAKISRSSCEPHRTFIVAELNKHRNMLSIHQDLVEHVGFTGSYDAVKRFARLVTPSSEPHVFCRYESELAAEAQVDYGEGAPTRHPQNGKYLKPRLFVMTLGASRKSFEKTVWKSSQQVWAELHEEAFAHFGGAPKLVRLDGLKEGVIKPDIYDPELNQLYAAVMAYYGTAALPCRPYAPNLKGKVERTIDYVQDSALKGRRFECIEDQNAFLLHWDERVASTRIHGTTKRQVRKAFEEERPFLLALPPRRFEYYKIHERRVHFDGHIEVGGAYYSTPPRYAGGTVIAHQGQVWLRVLDPISRECVREHAIAVKGSRRTADEDRPKQTPPQVLNLVARTALIGSASGAFARALESEQGALCARALFGLLDLAYRYGNDAVEHACSLAATAGTLRFRFLRIYLAAHAKPKPLAERHKIIPGIETYSKHFKQITRGEHDDQR